MPPPAPATPLIDHVHLVLAVPDLAVSATFYREVLGFEIREIGDPGWRMYVRDACTIMAGECPDALHPTQLGDHSYVAYLVVADVDGYHAALAAKAVTFIKPLRTEPWRMREFAIRTVDGHRLMIGQRLG